MLPWQPSCMQRYMKFFFFTLLAGAPSLGKFPYSINVLPTKRCSFSVTLVWSPYVYSPWLHQIKFSKEFLWNNWIRCVLFRVMHIIFHSASFENPIFGTCRAGWKSLFQLAPQLQPIRFLKELLWKIVYITRNKTQRKHFVWLQPSFHSGSKLHTHAIALFRPL